MATFVYSKFHLGIICNGCSGEYDLKLDKDNPQTKICCPYCQNVYDVRLIDESFALFEPGDIDSSKAGFNLEFPKK